MSDKSNKNNGMMTKIWGPHGWIFLHTVTFGYPLEPTDEQKIKYKNFFESVGDILPCKYCRESYKEFITNKTPLTDNVMQNRDTLTKWFYNIHENVNHKLGIDYGVTYEDVVARYESYRAICGTNKHKTCDAPVSQKSKSYKIAAIKDCPIIPLELAKKFIPYAKERGMIESEFCIIEMCSGKHDKDSWERRNKNCHDIITKMREEQILSLEEKGQYKGLPTQDELRLILRMSSNLPREELEKLVPMLPIQQKNKRKMFKLTK